MTRITNLRNEILASAAGAATITAVEKSSDSFIRYFFRSSSGASSELPFPFSPFPLSTTAKNAERNLTQLSAANLRSRRSVKEGAWRK